MAIRYHSTNNHNELVGFREAILKGIASNFGLYMMKRSELPKLSLHDISAMESMSYAEIAYQVLLPFVFPDIGEKDFAAILEDAYDETVIPVNLEHITGNTSLLWLSRGPTYSFKDFAARFFGRVLNHFLIESGLERVVVVATSGDTGGAVAQALLGLMNVSSVIFFPKGSISEEQRRQMTTLGKNIHAFAVNGDFDVCQEIAKALLSDRGFAEEVFYDRDRFTSANSISLGRLLPQAVYPFFAYARLGLRGDPLIASVPSGNFGDMMGTVIAKEMGLLAGDTIVGGDGRVIADMEDLGEFKSTPSRGDAFELTVLRDGEELVLHGRIPEPTNYLVFTRDTPSGLARVSYSANRVNVEVSRVAALRIFVHPEMIRLEENLVVRCDGEVVFDDLVEPDVEFLLRNFIENRDRRLLYVAEVTVELP